MPVKTWNGTDTRADTGPEHFTVTHEGHVLYLTEHNGWDDSDFYAMVWDDEAGEPREVWYATTRGWTYLNSATVDATDDVLAAFAAYRAQREDKARADRAYEQARLPLKGRTVTVTKGRKVPVGTTGVVFWAGVTRYGQRVGLKTDGGEKFFTAAANTEAVTGQEVSA